MQASHWTSKNNFLVQKLYLEEKSFLEKICSSLTLSFDRIDFSSKGNKADKKKLILNAAMVETAEVCAMIVETLSGSGADTVANLAGIFPGLC
mmetsp:Transcript_2873/g.4324  ORF Transcript_2873/g.4324 Transcript_2873/m.4324 type:complete len:93 (+) Transcript_2873:1330-1608(+)